MNSVRKHFLICIAASCFAGCGGLTGALNLTQKPEQTVFVPDVIPPVPARRDPGSRLTVATNISAVRKAEANAAMSAVPNASPASPSSTGFTLASIFGSGSTGSTGSGSKPAAYGPTSARADASAVSTYSTLARHIRKCWVPYTSPRLANHHFDGEASLQNGTSRIVLYEKAEGQKLGRYAFKIVITQDGSGSYVESENYRLTDRDAGQLRADIAAWASGKEGCSAHQS